MTFSCDATHFLKRICIDQTRNSLPNIHATCSVQFGQRLLATHGQGLISSIL
jgi:hypothetical protein